MEDGYSTLTVVAQVVAIIAGIVTIISFFTRNNNSSSNSISNSSHSENNLSTVRMQRLFVVLTCSALIITITSFVLEALEYISHEIAEHALIISFFLACGAYFVMPMDEDSDEKKGIFHFTAFIIFLSVICIIITWVIMVVITGRLDIMF